MSQSAMEAVLACVGGKAQCIHDGTLDDTMNPFVSQNPGEALGRQAAYYRDMGTRLQQADAGPSASLSTFKPPSRG